MVYYIGINIIILFFSVLIYGFNTSKKLSNKTNQRQNTIFLFCSFLILVFFSGFRGDFTSDYKNYASLFHAYNLYSLPEVLTTNFYQEKGYVLFSRLIGEFTNDPMYLMLCSSILIVLLFLKEFKRESRIVWLSILLFINIGAYYTSFNIIRHIMAVAIIFAGSKFIYNRKFFKFFVVVLIASFFHTTAIVFIPFYFILNARYNKRNFIAIILGSVITTIFIGDILNIIFRFGFQRYTNYEYGITGLNLTSAVVPIAILLFVLFHKNLINLKEIKTKIWFNATFYYAIFTILGLRIQMIQRFADFFAPYILLLIPLVISNIKNKNQKIIYYYLIVTLLIAYNYITLSGTGYDPYYFIWNR